MKLSIICKNQAWAWPLIVFAFYTAGGCSNSDVTGPTPSLSTFYQDTDGDGYGDREHSLEASGAVPAGYVTNSTDCDDHDNRVHPGSHVSTGWKIIIVQNFLKDFNCDGVYAQLPSRELHETQESLVTYSWDASLKKLSYFSYQGNSPETPISFTSEIVYDPQGSILSIIYRDSRSSMTPVISSVEYTYDAQGNKLTERNHNGDLTTPVISSVEYTYDAQGNRLTEKIHSDDLTTPVTSSRESTYDAQGHELTYKEHSRGDLTTPVTYSIQVSDFFPIRQPIRMY